HYAACVHHGVEALDEVGGHLVGLVRVDAAQHRKVVVHKLLEQRGVVHAVEPGRGLKLQGVGQVFALRVQVADCCRVTVCGLGVGASACLVTRSPSRSSPPIN